MGSLAGIYSWPSHLGEDSPSLRETTISIEENKQVSDKGYQLDH
jgi:hypothetical protein